MIYDTLWKKTIKRMLKNKESLKQKYIVVVEDLHTQGISSRTNFTLIPIRKSVLDFQSLWEHFPHIECNHLVKAEPVNLQQSRPFMYWYQNT